MHYNISDMRSVSEMHEKLLHSKCFALPVHYNGGKSDAAFNLIHNLNSTRTISIRKIMNITCQK